MIWSTAQTLAISTWDSNLVVSAGAGSGKTAVLIERAVALLEANENLHVGQILIMTFTEAAAGEMRGRLASRLEERIQACLEVGDRKTAHRFEREADRLWSSQISTIHSFCLELIRNHVFSLHVSPDFRLSDGNEEAIRLVQQAKETIETALLGPGADSVREMMIQLRLADVQQLTNVMRRMYALARSQQSPRVWLRDAADAYPLTDIPLSETAFFPAFRTYLSSRLALTQTTFAAARRLSNPIDELQAYTNWLEGAEAIVDEAVRYMTHDDIKVQHLCEILWRLDTLTKPRTSYKGVEADEVKEFRKMGQADVDAMLVIIQRGEQALVDDLRAMSGPIHVLCHLVEQFMDDVETQKRLNNVLDFGDLEHLAYQLLSSDKSVQMRVQATFQHVFVDEYQDTSPIQDAIVDLVTHQRQNLFAVGDVKQSIYRFRMAEPSLFLNRYAKYLRGDDGRTIDLTENYRSRTEVVDFVNFVFGQLFSEQTTDFAYDEHARMTSRASYPGVVAGTPLISVHLLDRSSQLASAEIETRTDALDSVDSADSDDAVDAQAVEMTALEREAQLTAELLYDMLYANPIDVWDKRAGRMRPARPGDAAVLLRSGRDALNTVVAALQSVSIPANANTSTGFFDAMEVKWLVSVLTVIDNPRDDLALVTALRSPLFNWTEEMLGRVRVESRGGSYWDALQKSSMPMPSADDHVADAVKTFRHQYSAWRDAARLLGVRELLNQVMRDTGFLTYVEGMTRGDLRRANVEKFLDMARSYDRANGDAGIYGFLDRWRAQDEANLDVGVAALDVSDAVQVMTIHRSKGLEFPVVFVIDLGKQFRVTQDLVYLHRDLGIGAVRYEKSTQQRWRTMASIATAETERKSTLTEEARILYVAMTRARERLILVGSTRNLTQSATSSVQAHDLTDGTLLSGAFMRARSYMDWLLPVLLRHPNASALRNLIARALWDGHILAGSDGVDVAGTLAVHLHNLDAVAMATATPSRQPESHPVDWDRWLDDAASTDVRERTIRIVERKQGGVDWLFAKVSATDMRRLDTALQADKAPSHPRHSSASALLDDPAFIRPSSATPREQGIAFHAFMQRCALPLNPSQNAVLAEVTRLVAQHQLSDQEATSLDTESVFHFLQSDLGHRLQQAQRIYREQPFFHRIDVATSKQDVYPVVAQGVIDCLFEEDSQWTVIDYKTDSVAGEDVATKARDYEAQVATYLAALQPLTAGKPVQAYLYFVHARVAIEVMPADLPAIFRKMIQQRTGES